jgi:hypothetical protein
MMYVWSGNLKDGKEKEYKDWVMKEYIDQMKKHADPSFKFLGIYGPAMSLGSRDVTEIWEFEKFADLDKVAENTDPVVNRLLSQSLEFFQPGSCRAHVLRDVKDWPE